MKLSCEAAITIRDGRHGDFVQTVTVSGEVWEPADAPELGVKLDSVEGLPHWLDLSDIQQEACILALQYEYERRARALDRLPQQLETIVADLQREIAKPTPQGHFPAYERIGALTTTLRVTVERLRALQEAA